MSAYPSSSGGGSVMAAASIATASMVAVSMVGGSRTESSMVRYCMELVGKDRGVRLDACGGSGVCVCVPTIR